MIEENKDKYFFQLSDIKEYNTFSLPDQTNKTLIISKTNFQELDTAVPLQINLKEIFVKILEVFNNNTYLLDAQEVLASRGLKDHEKIEFVTNKKISKKKIISLTVHQLQQGLQQISQELLSIEEEVLGHEFLVNEYLEYKWKPIF